MTRSSCVCVERRLEGSDKSLDHGVRLARHLELRKMPRTDELAEFDVPESARNRRFVFSPRCEPQHRLSDTFRKRQAVDRDAREFVGCDFARGLECFAN